MIYTPSKAPTTDLEALQDIELACAAFMQAHGARAESAEQATMNEATAVERLREALWQLDARSPKHARA